VHLVGIKSRNIVLYFNDTFLEFESIRLALFATFKGSYHMKRHVSLQIMFMF